MTTRTHGDILTVSANANDTKEIKSRIHECFSSDLAEKYTKTDDPKHFSPYFLVDKPGSSAERLLVHYGKLDKLTNRLPGIIPSLEGALERASACRYKSKLDKQSGFWNVNLTNGPGTWRRSSLRTAKFPNGRICPLAW